MPKGFGELIDRRVNELGFKPERVAKWLGLKSRSYYYRITSEKQEPTIDQVNRLAAELRLSVETILLSMGARFNPPEAATLPWDLVDAALKLDGRRRDYLIEIAQGLLLAQQAAVKQAEPPPPTLRAAAEDPAPYDSGTPAHTSRRLQP